MSASSTCQLHNTLTRNCTPPAPPSFHSHLSLGPCRFQGGSHPFARDGDRIHVQSPKALYQRPLGDVTYHVGQEEQAPAITQWRAPELSCPFLVADVGTSRRLGTSLREEPVVARTNLISPNGVVESHHIHSRRHSDEARYMTLGR